MSFRRSGESLDGLVTQELEARRKAQQQIAILARDQETLRSDTAADIAMAVAEATDLGMGYVYRNTNAAALADATSTLLTWQADVRNDDGLWVSGTNPSRITFRTGTYKVWGQWGSNAVAHTHLESSIEANGAGTPGAGFTLSKSYIGRTAGRGSGVFSTPPVTYDEGDYIELFVMVRGSAGTVTPIGTLQETWLAWERVE